MSEIDDLLGDVITEALAAPQSEFAPVPARPVDIAGQLVDPEQLEQFIAATMTAPAEAINDAVIYQGYAAVVWNFRRAALSGDIDTTRALKMWLDWAQPHIDRPKPTEERVVNPTAQNFLPRGS